MGPCGCGIHDRNLCLALEDRSGGYCLPTHHINGITRSLQGQAMQLYGIFQTLVGKSDVYDKILIRRRVGEWAVVVFHPCVQL